MDDDLKRAIRRQVAVTPQMVVIVKTAAFHLAAGATPIDSASIASACVAGDGLATTTPHLVLRGLDPDTSPDVALIARQISWKLATAEALHSMIGDGVLLGRGEQGLTFSVAYSTNPVGSGSNTSGGFDVDGFDYWWPAKVQRMPSYLWHSDAEYLSDPSLYLGTMAVSNMHADIVNALRESVSCFRTGLHTAAVAMLGKAVEGAWLELGDELVMCCDRNSHAPSQATRDALEDPNVGIMRKIEVIIRVYDNSSVFGPVHSATGMKGKQLAALATWTDTV